MHGRRTARRAAHYNRRMSFLEADIGALARCLAQVSDDPAALVEAFFERTEQTALAPRGETAAHRVWREEGFSIRLASRDETWMVSRDGIDGTDFLEALRKTARRMAQGLRPPPRLRAAPAPELPDPGGRARLQGRSRKRAAPASSRLSAARSRCAAIAGGSRSWGASWWPSPRARTSGACAPLLDGALVGRAAAGARRRRGGGRRRRRWRPCSARATRRRRRRGRGDLLLGASAAAVLLHEAVAHALEVDTLALTGDPAAAVGHRVGSEALDLLDDPSGGPSGLRRATDDEGVPVLRRWLLRRGIIEQPLADRRWARRSPALLSRSRRGASRATGRRRRARSTSSSCPAAKRSPISPPASTTASTPPRRRAASSIRCRDCSSCAFPTGVDCATAGSTSGSARSDCAARWATCWRASRAPGARSRSPAPAGAPREGSACRCGARRRGSCCAGSRSPVDHRVGPRGARAAARTGLLESRGLRQARPLAPLRARFRRRRPWSPRPPSPPRKPAGRCARAVGPSSFFFAAAGNPATARARGPRRWRARRSSCPRRRRSKAGASPPELAESLLSEDEGWRLLRQVAADARAAPARRGAPRRARRRRERGAHLESPRPRRRAPRPLRVAATRGAHAGGSGASSVTARAGRAIGAAPSLRGARGSRGRSARGARDGIDRRAAESADMVLAPEVAARLLAPIAARVRRPAARDGGGAARSGGRARRRIERGHAGRRRPLPERSDPGAGRRRGPAHRRARPGRSRTPGGDRAALGAIGQRDRKPRPPRMARPAARGALALLRGA